MEKKNKQGLICQKAILNIFNSDSLVIEHNMEVIGKEQGERERYCGFLKAKLRIELGLRNTVRPKRQTGTICNILGRKDLEILKGNNVFLCSYY